MRLTDRPIDAREVIERVSRPGAGAVLTFAGTVRDTNVGRTVVAIDYHAYAEMAEKEEVILLVTTDGLGTRASAYDFPVKGRGGQGVNVMDLKRGKGRDPARLVAAFPVEDGDHLMLVTDGGKLIRCTVQDISFQSRTARGVKIFEVDADEMVVSVAHLEEDESATKEDNGTEENGTEENGSEENGSEENGSEEAGSEED